MFGHYLKYMRLKRGMKQKDLAAKLFIAPCTLSHYENGSRLVPYTILLLALDICKFRIRFYDVKDERYISDDDVIKSTLD